MEINWDDNSKRKIFRLALQDVYPNKSQLEMFVNEELNINLAIVAGESNLQDTAFDLIVWAKAKGRLEELFEAFCEENPAHLSISQLKQQDLVKKLNRLNPEDIGKLFGQFSYQNLADILKAFLEAFKSVKGDFWTYRPDNPPLNELVQIQDLLEVYDDPTLFVRFAEKAIIELQKSNIDKDYATLRTLGNRITQQYNVPPETPKLHSTPTKQGYLLVALQDKGQVSQGNPSVTIFTYLHVTGETNPIDFDAPSPPTCFLNEVSIHLSALIKKAENALIPYEAGRVTVELFLPCIHIEENIADWEVRNEQNRPRPLGMHRSFIVRSFERLLNPTTQTVLKRNWQILKSSVEANNVCEKFYRHETPLSPGILESFLESIPGLMLTADLPIDSTERQDIFYDIINSAVPIALWSINTSVGTADERRTEFDNLIRESYLTNFCDLAQKWRQKRNQPSSAAIKHLRLLCDCPDRWPNLPDSRRDEDLLIAS